jgi:hypothetical protein
LNRIMRAACVLLIVIGSLLAASAADTTSHVTTLAVPGRSNATPSIAADGRFVAVAWGATTSDGKADVFIATSRNGGLTFGSPVQVNTQPGEARLGGEMPPRVAILKTASYGGPDVLVLWTARGATTSIKLARSTNGGRAFDDPLTLQTPAAPGDRGWPALTLDSHGTPHAIWLDHRDMAAATSGGAATHHHDAGATPRDPVAMAQKSALHYASAGIAGGAADVVDRELTRGVCYCCKTSLVAGREGTLFAAWRQVYPGSLRDIAFTVSRDEGKTFAPPTPISRDGWAIDVCPDDGPAMAVDVNQTVHIVWPTVIGSTGDDPRGVLFYTSTRDGGRTFAPRTQIPGLGSAKASHPQIAIDHAGRLFVAWDESIGGKRTAAVREIKPAAVGVGAAAATFGPILTLTADAPGQYPVLASTSDNLLAAWTTSTGITVARVNVADAAASTR